MMCAVHVVCDMVCGVMCDKVWYGMMPWDEQLALLPGLTGQSAQS